MKSTKLKVFLSKLSDSEWKKFRTYLKNKYSSTHNVNLLFAIIYRNRIGKGLSTYQPEAAHKKLFAHISTKSFQNIESIIRIELENFWVIQDIQSDIELRNLIKLKALSKRGIYPQFRSFHNTGWKEEKVESPFDLWFHYHKLKEAHTIYFSNNPIKNQSKPGQELLSNCISHTLKFASNLLEFYKAEMFNRQQIWNEDWKEFDALYAHLALPSQSNLFHQSLKEQTRLINQNYLMDPIVIKDLLFNYQGKLSPEVAITYYYRLRRFYIIKARSGNKEKINELLKLIQWSVDSQLLLFNGHFDTKLFIGDIKIFCAVHQFEKAFEYIQRNILKLPAPLQKETSTLAEMYINYEETKFEQVIQSYLLNTFSNYINKLDAASLFFKTSYEVYGKDANYFEYQIKNIRDFLRRNSRHFSELQIKAHQRFFKAFQMLVTRKQNDKIIKFLSENENVVNRLWLLEKLKPAQ